jgi:lipoteichoic acid synthase
MNSLNLVDSNDVNYFETDSFIYDFMPSASVFVDKFGMEEFLIRDLQKNVFTHTDTSQEEMELVKEYLAENTAYQSNAETGVFAGKSVILIQAESLTTMAIDPVLTPTLYQLENDGWYFKNYHSPLLEGSTSTTELMSNTSLLSPNDGNTPAITYGGNTYPTSIPKLFAANGYKIDAFHNNYANYYNREQFFPSIGYEDFYDSYKLGVANLESDYTCGKVIDWMDVADTTPYLSLWVTYSGHQDYTVDFSNSEKYGPSCAEEYTAYLNTVKQTYPNLTEEMQVYLAKNMSLDRAVKDYIDTFESQGRDDIVLVIYGDHFVKEFTDQARVDSGKIFDSNRSLNHTPLIIWTPGIESRVIDKYCSSLDILPTLCNLFGISYDRNTVFGNDVFDDRYIGFYFDIDLSLYGDGWVYSLSNHEYKEEPTSNQEAINAMIQRFMKATYISTYLFQTNYFASDVYKSGQ